MIDSHQALAELTTCRRERAALAAFLWRVAEALGVQPEGGWPDPANAGITEQAVLDAIETLKPKETVC